MIWLGGFSVLVILVLWAPLLVISSRGMHWDAFVRLFEREDILSAAYQSLGLAFLSGLLATILGTVIAFSLPALPPRMRRWVNMGLVFPMVLPEIAMGLSFLVWFIKLGISLGWGTLIASHVAFSLSYATLVMKARVETLDSSLVDACWDLGASPFQVFRHGIFPQLKPGLMASLVTCFALSLDDFLITFFVKGLDQMTLPVQIFSMVRIRISPEIYALSLILFCLSLICVLFTQLWKHQKT